MVWFVYFLGGAMRICFENITRTGVVNKVMPWRMLNFTMATFDNYVSRVLTIKGSGNLSIWNIIPQKSLYSSIGPQNWWIFQNPWAIKILGYKIQHVKKVLQNELFRRNFWNKSYTFFQSKTQILARDSLEFILLKEK